MPSSAARSGTRGLPPFGLDDSDGSNGPITSHNPSLTKASGIFRTSDPPKGLPPPAAGPPPHHAHPHHPPAPPPAPPAPRKPSPRRLPAPANPTPTSTTAPPAACQGPRASPRIA